MTGLPTNKRVASQDYLAVPLDLPISDPEHRITYNRVSLERIQRSLTVAMQRALDIGWVEDTKEDTDKNNGKGLAKRISHLIDLSLTQSHVTRLHLNRHYDEIFDTPNEDLRIVRAAKGAATPEDLLGLLIEHPDLYSIELAKLSHPLDVKAPAAMDLDVQQTIVSQGGELLSETPKYKPKTRELSIPAMTILRKRKIGRIASQAGEISVVSRQAYLVRGDEAARHEAPYVDRKIKNEDRFGELKKAVEMELPALTANSDAKWLQPIATSYYAKYLNPKKEA